MKKSYSCKSPKGIAITVTQKKVRCSVSPITKNAIQPVAASVKPIAKDESNYKGNES